jgi:hypothetical protein
LKAAKGKENSSASLTNLNQETDTQVEPMTYKEWLKHKDAEKRLKRKLITTAQDETRK